MRKPGVYVTALAAVLMWVEARAVCADTAVPLIVFHAPAQAPPEVAVARSALNAVARERLTAVIDLSPLPEPLPTAQRHLARAIESYHNFAYDQAVAEIRIALEEAQRTGANGLTASELSDIYLYRALLATQRGDAAEAWDDFIIAATIEPIRRLDPVRFPPRVIETYQRAIDAVAAAAHATVIVEAHEDCEVHFDGRRVGAGDALRAPWGEHFVRVRCEGYRPYGGSVAVEENRAVVVPNLRKVPVPTDQRVQTIARERGAEKVISATTTVTEGVAPTITMRLIDVTTGAEQMQIFAKIAGPNGSEADLRAAVERLIDHVVAPPIKLVSVPVPPEPIPWYRNGWLWGSVGGVALTAAILLPFVLDSDPNPSLSVRPGGKLP